MYSIYHENLPSLDDIRRAHERGRVIISRADDYLICKYSQQTVISGDWDDLTMNARGTIYDERTGELVFLPFPKFFNHGENSLSASSLPTTGIAGAEILEKLDGSMGAVWMDRDGEIRVSTPGSIVSDQALWATAWLRNHHSYDALRDAFQSGRIRGKVSEILYPGSQVVVDYDYASVQGIHLTAAQVVREDGLIQYASHDELEALSQEFDLGRCNIYDFESFDALRSHLKEVDNFEGFILHWPDSGFRLKLKADEYIRLHRIISRIHPNRIEEAILSNEARAATDPMGVLKVVEECVNAFPEEHRGPYEDALNRLSVAAQEMQTTVLEGVARLREQYSGFVGPAFKKACAIDIKNGSAGIEMRHSAMAFALLDGKTPDYSKLTYGIWKKVREEIDWKGGDSPEEES